MNFYLTTALSFSILPGAVAAWIRFEKADPRFYPFLYLLWLGLANEIISTTVILAGGNNVINTNLFTLLQALLLLFLFHNLGLFKRRGTMLVLIGVLGLTWLAEWIWSRNTNSFSSYHILVQSFTIVILSINTINEVLLTEPRHLLRNPVFIISLALVVYFTYSILVELYWLYGSPQSMVFQINVLMLHAIINVLTNIMFLLAVLWMPRKRNFFLS